jgi:hypothetical protein
MAVSGSGERAFFTKVMERPSGDQLPFLEWLLPAVTWTGVPPSTGSTKI